MSDQQHEWRQVRVTFRKSVSDGNYGTEAAEVTLETWVDSAEFDSDYRAVAADLLHEARLHAHAELLRSSSARVREGIDRVRTYAAGPDDDGEE